MRAQEAALEQGLHRCGGPLQAAWHMWPAMQQPQGGVFGGCSLVTTSWTPQKVPIHLSAQGWPAEPLGACHHTASEFSHQKSAWGAVLVSNSV